MAAGLRAALVTVAPLLAGYLLLERPAFIWMATGGFVAVLVDSGGSYRSRAVNLTAVTLAAATAVATAALLGHSPVLAVAGALVWATAGAFLRAYGATGTNVGLVSSVVFVVSVSMPAELDGALMRGVEFLVGGAWAVGLGLLLWPFDPQRPARRAVAQCYRALADYALAVARRAEESRLEEQDLAEGFEGVRGAVEAGWSTLAPGWSGRGTRSLSGERLLVLLESADQMLGTLVALADVADRQRAADVRSGLAAAIREAVPLLASLATRVEQEDAPALDLPRWRGPDLHGGGGGEEDAELRHAEELVWMLREFADGALETVAGFRARTLLPVPSPAPPGGDSWLRPVRENLSTDSVLLRHSLRVGITTALAVAIAEGFGLGHGYWIPLTVLFILQPSTGLTLVRGMQRVLGTVLGGILAALVPLAVPDPLGILAVVFLLAAATVAAWPVNYALFTFFVTPTFVLLADLEAGISLYRERIGYTLVGGLLALVGARFFWSVPERRQFPAHMAAALRATASYLEASAAAATGRLPDELVLPTLRRRAGLAVINTGESYQRLVIELGESGRAVERSRTLSVYLRRLVTAIVGLSAIPPSRGDEAEAVQRFAGAALDALLGIADAVAGGRPPAPMPSLLELVPHDSPLRPQLERIDRPLRVIHAAAARTPIPGSSKARNRERA